MLRIVKRQTIHALAQDLADVVCQQTDVFANIPIIVPSMAMGDWLNQYLAEKNGVSALTDCHFFGMMQWAWVEEVTGDKAFQPQAPLSMSGIHWQLFAWLYANGESFLKNKQHPLHELLSVLFEGNTQYEEGAVARLWTLSEQFARIFVRYITLRPNWLHRWRDGEDLDIAAMITNRKGMPEWLQRHYHQLHDTQRYMWQTLFTDTYAAREQRVAHFWQILAEQPDKVSLLPSQIVVFTLQGMTPDMIHFIEKLSLFVDVVLYHFTPTYQMIDDIVDAKWLQRYHIDHIDAQDAHFDAGHTLISRFGKQARDQARLLSQIDNHGQNQDLNVEIDDDSNIEYKQTLLGILQREMYDLDSNAPSRDYVKLLYEQNRFAQDNSLRVHACHGLFRQLEVLRSELVQWLNEDTTRQLSDILIVLPEIGEEQSLIQAVFPPDGRYDGLALPARLTGVIAPNTMNLWTALSGYFTLLDHSFNAREVIDWLLLEENAEALGLSVDEMQRSVSMLQQAGFKRGFDEQHLQETLAAGDDDYRFCFTYALDRLVVGLLMPEVAHYHDSVPMPHITMADADNINALTTAASIISRIRAQQARAHDIYEWLDLIEDILLEHFTFASHTQAYVVIQQSIIDLRYQLYAQDELLQEAERHPLPLAFVLNYIEKGLADRQVSSEPSGVITIGRLSALRSLPYKLIAFLNVNIDDFPSTGMDERYDLTTIDKRQDGDQIKEEDDLGAFLDVLLSAQEACWFFYDRYKPEDSHEHLPSIVLQELLDHLFVHCQEPEQAQAQFIIEHPQNPFGSDARYNTVVPLWQSIQQRLTDLQTQPLQPPHSHLLSSSVPSFAEVFEQDVEDASSEVIALHNILYELIRPAKTFARAHGLSFLSEVDVAEAYEPLQADGLIDYAMIDLFIDQQMNERTLDVETVKRLPNMPAGAYGKLWLKQTQQDFEQTLAELLSFTGVSALTSLHPQQVQTAHLTLSANLPAVNHYGPWVMMIAGKCKNKHILNAWLHHLSWMMLSEYSPTENTDHAPSTNHVLTGCTVVQFKDDLLVFEPLTSAQVQNYVEDWLSVWRYLQQHLWLAPVELLFEAYSKTAEKDASEYDETLHRLCRQWIEEGEYNHFYKLDSPEIWAHLLQDSDQEAVIQTQKRFVGAYMARLIAPIYYHQRVEDKQND